jgi:hypothetical protein
MLAGSQRATAFSLLVRKARFAMLKAAKELKFVDVPPALAPQIALLVEKLQHVEEKSTTVTPQQFMSITGRIIKESRGKLQPKAVARRVSSGVHS